MKQSIINRKRIESILLIIVGTFIMTIGTIFFNMPLNIAAGGITGLSQVLQSLIPGLNIGIFMAIMNGMLLILGAVNLGKEFGLYTIIGSISYTAFMTLFDFVFTVREPILEESIANLVLGAVLIGLGLALVFRQNASTGGSDVLAKILEKKFGINVSKAMLMVDTFVIVFAGAVFGIQEGIYAFMSLYITTYILDVTISGFNLKIQMTIISNKVEIINTFIQKEISRGTTFYSAKGGYTMQDKYILITVVDQKQYIKIKNYIDCIDNDAFVYITNIREAIGYGFTREQVNNVQTGEDTVINN